MGNGVDDCISRQAAIDYCYALINAENPSDPSDEWNYSQERINQTEAILHHLEFMPSASPVQPNHNAEVSKMEIVHCENCEYWDTSWETVYGLHYCPMIDMATKKNFFCKYGAEKRGEA